MSTSGKGDGGAAPGHSPDRSFVPWAALDVLCPRPAAPCTKTSPSLARRRVGSNLQESRRSTPPRRSGGGSSRKPAAQAVRAASARSLSAGGQLQHRRHRRSPLYGDHIVSAHNKVSSTRAGRVKEGRMSRWHPSAGCSMRPHARCQHEWSRGGRTVRTGWTDRSGAVYSTSRTVGSMAFECMGRAKNW